VYIHIHTGEGRRGGEIDVVVDGGNGGDGEDGSST
jgi:hypothetical protein